MTGTHDGRVSGTLTGTHDSEFALPQPLPTTPTPSTSSRSDAQTRGREVEQTHQARLATITDADLLAAIALRKRSDWTATDCHRWAATDDRAFDVKLAAACRAHDRDIRTPNGLRYVAGDYDGAPTPLPPSLEEWRNAKRCDDHGEIVGKCALCRHRIGGTA